MTPQQLGLNCSNKTGWTSDVLTPQQPQRFSPTIALRYADGFIDYAINLIESGSPLSGCVRLRFRQHSFETLSAARGFLGNIASSLYQANCSEISGAMTGGSSTQRSGLHFGTVRMGI